MEGKKGGREKVNGRKRGKEGEKEEENEGDRKTQ